MATVHGGLLRSGASQTQLQHGALSPKPYQEAWEASPYDKLETNTRSADHSTNSDSGTYRRVDSGFQPAGVQSFISMAPVKARPRGESDLGRPAATKLKTDVNGIVPNDYAFPTVHESGAITPVIQR